MAFSDEELQKMADGYQVQKPSPGAKAPNLDAVAFTLLSAAIIRRKKRGEDEPNESIDLYKKLSQMLEKKFEEHKKLFEQAQVKIFTPKTSYGFSEPIRPSAKKYRQRKDIFGD